MLLGLAFCRNANRGRDERCFVVHVYAKRMDFADDAVDILDSFVEYDPKHNLHETS